MRLNQNTAIVGRAVLLVPYEEIHVERYHSWMKSPEIQRLTASEPLSLEEEYAMQRSWREDDDKLTYIVVDKSIWDNFDTESDGDFAMTDKKRLSKKQTSCMVGDVNLFLNDDMSRATAEIEIMIAEEKSRKKGLATESLQLMMAFAIMHLKMEKFVAKIGCENVPSIKLFTQKLGFHEVSRSEVFQEVTLEKTFDLSDGHDIAIEREIGLPGFRNMIIDYDNGALR